MVELAKQEPQPSSHTFLLDNAWRLVLKDLALDADELLRRADLPRDLFGREGARLDAVSYFRLWTCLEEMTDDPELALKIGQMISVEHFSPPIFAAFCSPDLYTAAMRLSQFKRLIGPMELLVEMEHDQTAITYGFLSQGISPPASLILVELIFLVRLARLGTREAIVPAQVITSFSVDADATEGLASFFGVSKEEGESNTLVFQREDAIRPFLTANEKMWDFFASELRQRLSALDVSATASDRVKSALLELLPSGRATLGQVARELHVSTRTLQRRLKQEQTNFQQLLNESREQLARHYLKSSSMSGAEIAFLLGFDEPNSFFRAFHAWTGETPERVRASYQHPN